MKLAHTFAATAAALILSACVHPHGDHNGAHSHGHASHDTMTASLTSADIRAADDMNGSPFPGHLTKLLLQQGETVADLSILEVVVPPESFGAPPHVHHDEDEYFYVVDGEVTFMHGEETTPTGPGGLAILPRGNLHGFWNASTSPAKMLMILAPGQFGTFFDEVVVELRNQNASSPQEAGRIMGEIAAARNVEIYPDKVPEEALRFLPR